VSVPGTVAGRGPPPHAPPPRRPLGQDDEFHPSSTLVVATTIPPKLDYQSPAIYGEANLSNGFSPDPYSVGMTAGAPST